MTSATWATTVTGPGRQCTGGVPLGLVGIDSSDCIGTRSGETCIVSCRSGFESASAEYFCGADGLLHGTGPFCQGLTCSGGIPAGLEISDCIGKRSGEWCVVSCARGFVPKKSIFACLTDRRFHGMPPVCERPRCAGELVPQAEGLDSSDCFGSLLANETCTVTCQPGYTGVPAVHACREDGTFAGASPRCDPVMCSIPSDLDSSEIFHTCSGMSQGQSCVASCAHGYEGPAVELSCDFSLSPRLQGDLPVCTPAACSRRLPFGFGVDASDCLGTRTGETCTASCKPGFQPSPSWTSSVITFFCGPDGAFRSAQMPGDQKREIACEPAPCADLNLSSTEVFNSTAFEHTCRGRTSGQSCVVSCADGYDLVGPPVLLVCDVTTSDTIFGSEIGIGDFRGVDGSGTVVAPVCLGRTCTKGIPRLLGVVQDCDGKVTGETCFATASPGFAYESGSGPATLTCGADGAFGLLPSVPAMPRVRAQECTRLPGFGIGALHTCDLVGKLLGSRCWAFCAAGYEGIPAQYECKLMDGLAFLELQAVGENLSCTPGTGRRLSAVPISAPRSCDSLALPEAYDLAGGVPVAHTCTSVASGGRCLAQCTDGYTMMSPSPQIFECEDGTYRPLLQLPPPTAPVAFPVCEARQCLFGPLGLGAGDSWGAAWPGVTHNCSGAVTGEKCRATCGATGYSYAPGEAAQELACGAFGDFSGRVPRCQPTTTCELPAPALSGPFRTGSCLGKTVGQHCAVECAEGWVLHNSEAQIFLCEPSGEFSGRLPECEPAACDAESGIPAGADLDPGEDCSALTTGQSCSVACAGSYSGEATSVTCSPSGGLRGEPPVCQPLRCSTRVLADAMPGTVHTCGPDVSLGQRCSVTCGAGFHSVQSSALSEWTCAWDAAAQYPSLQGSALECEPLQCADGLPRGAELEHNCSEVYMGEECIVACAQGYEGQPEVLICLSSGFLAGRRPTCTPQVCEGRLDVVSGARPGLAAVVDNCGDGVPFGSSCAAACAPGHGSDTQEWSCAASSEQEAVLRFAGNLPQCIARPCLIPSMSLGARYTHNCDGIVTGESCTVDCAEGFAYTNPQTGDPTDIWCEAGGVFSGPLPECFDVMARGPVQRVGLGYCRNSECSDNSCSNPWHLRSRCIGFDECYQSCAIDQQCVGFAWAAEPADDSQNCRSSGFARCVLYLGTAEVRGTSTSSTEYACYRFGEANWDVSVSIDTNGLPTVFTGSLLLTLLAGDPTLFAVEPGVRRACVEVLARISGAPTRYISVNLQAGAASPGPAPLPTRRLGEDDQDVDAAADARVVEVLFDIAVQRGVRATGSAFASLADEVAARLAATSPEEVTGLLSDALARQVGIGIYSVVVLSLRYSVRHPVPMSSSGSAPADYKQAIFITAGAFAASAIGVCLLWRLCSGKIRPPFPCPASDKTQPKAAQPHPEAAQPGSDKAESGRTEVLRSSASKADFASIFEILPDVDEQDALSDSASTCSFATPIRVRMRRGLSSPLEGVAEADGSPHSASPLSLSPGGHGLSLLELGPLYSPESAGSHGFDSDVRRHGARQTSGLRAKDPYKATHSKEGSAAVRWKDDAGHAGYAGRQPAGKVQMHCSRPEHAARAAEADPWAPRGQLRTIRGDASRRLEGRATDSRAHSASSGSVGRPGSSSKLPGEGNAAQRRAGHYDKALHVQVQRRPRAPWSSPRAEENFGGPGENSPPWSSPRTGDGRLVPKSPAKLLLDGGTVLL